jgi:hypothetical protein
VELVVLDEMVVTLSTTGTTGIAEVGTGAGVAVEVVRDVGEDGVDGEPEVPEVGLSWSAAIRSEAGVIPGGPPWTAAKDTLVPRTATTATSGTTSLSSIAEPSSRTRSPTTTYERCRQDPRPADPRDVQETSVLRPDEGPPGTPPRPGSRHPQERTPP